MEREPNSNDFCLECAYTDKATYKVSLTLLEQIIAKAAESGKLPGLILGFKRNEKEMIILKCVVSIEKKGKK